MRSRRHETLTSEKANAVTVAVCRGPCQLPWLWLCRLWWYLWPGGVPVAVLVDIPFASKISLPVHKKLTFLQKRLESHSKTNIF